MRHCQLGNERKSSQFPCIIISPIFIRHNILLLATMIVLGLHAGCISSDSGRRTLAFRPFSRHTNKSSLKSTESTLADSQELNEQASTINSANSISLRENDGSSPQRASDVPTRNPSCDARQIRQVAAEEGLAYDPVVDAKAELPDPSSKDYPPVVETVVPHQLTLGDLENLALANNPTLVQAQAEVTGQEGIYHQAGLYPNPQVGFINSSASNPSVKQSNGAFFAQEFVTANKLGLAQQAASEELRRFQWDNEAQRIRVMNDLKIRYYEVLGSQEAVAVYRQLLTISEKSLAIAKSLLANEGTRTDYLQAKVQLETVRLNLDEAELRYAAAWEQLATMVGVSTLNPVPLVGDLTDDIPQLDLETCWQQLLSSSPQLRSAEAELGHGYATFREQQALAVPNITVQTVADYDQATAVSTVSTLVALPFPIFNRNQGNIAKAAADINADQADICRIQLVLRDSLADSFRRYKTSLRQAERLREAILPDAKENLKLSTQLFEGGQSAFAPVLAAQQSYFRSEVAYVEALTELHKVSTEIQGLQLTGGLNPAAIGSAIQNQMGGGAQRQRALLNDLQENGSKQLLPAAQFSR